MFKTAGAAAFFAAWQGLCQKSQVPHYRDAFQQLPSELLPHLAVLEAAPKDQYILRFLGTARAEAWGEDLTGKNALALMPPALAAAARRNMATLSEHPCGLHHIAHYAVPTGREMMVENITVPVANDPGLPRRVINYVTEISTIAYGEHAGEIRGVAEQMWLDIGSGVPKKSPAK